MLKYAARRIALMVLVLVGISVIVFFLSRVVPSEPASLYVGPLARPEQLEAAKIKLGLDQPLPVQYVRYMGDLVRGDWGVSLRTRRPVNEDILRFLPNSLELIVMSLSLSILVGVPLGALVAKKKDRFLDHFARLGSIAGVSVPSFWLALLFQILFVRTLGLLPVGGRISMSVGILSPIHEITGFMLVDAVITGNLSALQDLLRHSVMPVLTLAAYPIGMFTRMTRSTMLEVLGNDYIRTARSFGVKENRITFVYALKNAIGPTLTVIGLTFAYALLGAFFVEVIFSWPGIGVYAVNGILSMDYPAILGVCLVVAFFYILVNLVIDLLQSALDPRINVK
ncbi:MAG: ABC transporter permease [Bacillota bacterium]